MNRRFQNLQLQQMDATLTPWQQRPLNPPPARGWTRAIRDALGMTAVAFAHRLGMSPAGVHKLEQAEANETITLASLKKNGCCVRLRTPLRLSAEGVITANDQEPCDAPCTRAHLPRGAFNVT